MKKIAMRVLPPLGLVALAAGCASRPIDVPAPGDIPEKLHPIEGQQPFLSVRAAGVQAYECLPKADAPGGWAWTFQAPLATLSDASGRRIGHHFAGPSWSLDDGGTVVGQLVASAPSPRAGAIPWLLLVARSHAGSGLLAQTASVQRLDTTGGLAPASPCTSANARDTARVDYSATYVFWRVVR